jgi:hypothetical protein
LSEVVARYEHLSVVLEKAVTGLLLREKINRIQESFSHWLLNMRTVKHEIPYTATSRAEVSVLAADDVITLIVISSIKV